MTSSPPIFQVGHLERLTLGTPYPGIVAHVGRLLGKLPAGTELVIDITGGRETGFRDVHLCRDLAARQAKGANLLSPGAKGWQDAFLRFGKGRHPAALNYGDCMTYATARIAEAPLLYTGSDFSKTDIERA